MYNINPIIKWWVTPKLPSEYIFILADRKPKEFYRTFGNNVRRWFIHPIKRRIAKYYLRILQKLFGIKVIGITGSSGKTTTKEMAASILRQEGRTISSYANIDPVYNIPTTILKCRPNTKYLVLEMGVEYPGEMDFYLWLAKPDIGLITNIGIAHTEFLKNIKGVVKEKSKLVRQISKDGYSILNADDANLSEIGGKLTSNVLWFGDGGSIYAKDIRNKRMKTNFTLVINKNNISVHLPGIGRQMVTNSLAAASVGYIFGVNPAKIKEGIETSTPQAHRMSIVKHKSGAIILDDTYNSNPKACEEALKTLVETAGISKKVAVLGDMLELGVYEKQAHRKIGKIVSLMGIDFLIGVGEASKVLIEEASKNIGKKRTAWVKDVNYIHTSLKPYLRQNTFILIKGSRAVGLDKIISRLS